MPNRSKIYPVKSNAARAAAQYGVPRANLFEASNTETGVKGWAFTIPDGVTPQPQKKKAKGEATGGETKAKPAKPAKPAKAAKPKAAKPAKSKPKAKAKATGPRRKAGPKVGKGAAVLAKLKARWTPASEILADTGWVSNTFRGFLGLTKLKAKANGETFDWETKKVEGETYYRIAA